MQLLTESPQNSTRRLRARTEDLSLRLKRKKNTRISREPSQSWRAHLQSERKTMCEWLSLEMSTAARAPQSVSLPRASWTMAEVLHALKFSTSTTKSKMVVHRLLAKKLWASTMQTSRSNLKEQQRLRIRHGHKLLLALRKLSHSLTCAVMRSILRQLCSVWSD